MVSIDAEDPIFCGIRKNSGQNENQTCKNGIDPKSIQKILHESGHQAKFTEFENHCVIRSSSNGTKFKITLTLLHQISRNYQILTISAAYENNGPRADSIVSMNRINKERPFINGYVDDDGAAVLKMEWFVPDSISNTQLSRWLELWRACLVVFEWSWQDNIQ